MGYVLGVDLGTTYTAAATWDSADGKARMLGLGNRALQIPSVLYRHSRTLVTPTPAMPGRKSSQPDSRPSSGRRTGGAVGER